MMINLVNAIDHSSSGKHIQIQALIQTCVYCMWEPLAELFVVQTNGVCLMCGPEIKWIFLSN